MKKSILLFLGLFILAGCKDESTNTLDAEFSKAQELIDKEQSQSGSSTVATTTESSESNHEYVALSVYQPRYTLKDNIFNLTGKATPEIELNFTFENNDIKTIKADSSGNFDFQSNLSDKSMSVVVSDGTDEKQVTIKSKVELEEVAKQQDIQQEENKKQQSTIEQTTESDDTSKDTPSLLPYQEEGVENADTYPASVGKILYDKEDRKFKGMNYFFEGEILGEIKLANITDGNAWLVKNSNGYVMPIEYNYFTASTGDKVKVWGTLSGLQFSNADLGVDNVVGATGSMHAMSVEVNGEIQY